MNTIDPLAAMKLQPELSSGETIYWAGMPNANTIFHSEDWYLIPFSFFWGGFAIFGESGVLGIWGNQSQHHPAPRFMILWGLPFVVIGQYLIWGRFLYDAWLKRRTYYGITNRRVLILQEGQKRKTQFSFLESIPEITQEGDDIGTIWLGTKQPIFGTRQSGTSSWSRFSVGGSVPKLSDIDGVNSVYRLILDLREQARKQPSPAN
jgi:hypothetical protein